MSKITLGMASSHAFTLEDPSRWDEGRQRNRQMYARRYGAPPTEHPGVAEESDQDINSRYARIRDGLSHLREKLDQARPDVLIMIADDQNENLRDDKMPQLAIYLGDDFLALSRGSNQEPVHYRGAPKLANTIYTECVESDIDMAGLHALPDNTLLAHAFGPVLRVVDPNATCAVIPIFVNAIHVPAPSPARCYHLGQTIGHIVSQYPGAERVAVYASGGLSHFTGGYPWAHYKGPHGYGSIDREFDHKTLSMLEAGRGHESAELTSDDLINSGNIEFRSWITLLGAIGDAPPELLVYEPFHRGLMGMAVACWDLAA